MVCNLKQGYFGEIMFESVHRIVSFEGKVAEGTMLTWLKSLISSLVKGDQIAQQYKKFGNISDLNKCMIAAVLVKSVVVRLTH